ncbi:MAG TPA: tetratricopeptide repeat protein [Blastocatellia bacterium]|nr:tetratricopeptide repeat protein [Blastocatellia bacterium]HMX25819.1 tetratricopeptide repeat protein [Blastocatellia bacterium]HMY71876.1 tetratricopeptide repeat protein [Blastocatellia bacterium]HMZ18789.1 tetratricopeptide repeat protein [Blastocatellia bacterium]HNG29618.1 tetratricopeptide repeat protein [Blastocatellia bacterium]
MGRVCASIVILFVLAVVVNAQNTRTTTASSYLERGNQWLNKDEIEKAIEDYSFALSFEPQADRFHLK